MAFWGSKSFGKVTFISPPSLETGESHIISKFQNMACKEINHTCFKSLVFFHQDTGKTRAKHHPILPTGTTAPGSSLIPSSKRWQHRSCLQEPVAAWDWSFVLPCEREESKGTLIPSDNRISNRASPSQGVLRGRCIKQNFFCICIWLIFHVNASGENTFWGWTELPRGKLASTAHHKHLWKILAALILFWHLWDWKLKAKVQMCRIIKTSRN